MAPGVVADQVPRGDDASCEVVLGLREFSNHEKRSTYVMLRKNIEQSRSPGGVGSVVEGEGQFAGLSRSDEGTAEDLGGGPVCCI